MKLGDTIWYVHGGMPSRGEPRYHLAHGVVTDVSETLITVRQCSGCRSGHHLYRRSRGRGVHDNLAYGTGEEAARALALLALAGGQVVTLRVGDRIWYAHWWPGRPGGSFRAASGVVASTSPDADLVALRAGVYYVCVVHACSACPASAGLHHLSADQICASEEEAERAAALRALAGR